MLSDSLIKKILEYSVLISAAYCAFCASGCANFGDHWKIYWPTIQQDPQITSADGNRGLTEESSSLMKLLEDESLKPLKDKN